jgi:hypothetical protein
MPRRHDDWIDDDEYPDDSDIERFGEYSPTDYDPLTIGRFGRRSTPVWTRSRIIIAIVALFLLMVFVVAELAPLLSR